MKIDNEYDFGDIVYIRTDLNQDPHIITSMQVYKGGEIIYTLRSGGVSSTHYDFELSKDKDILLTTTN